MRIVGRSPSVGRVMKGSSFMNSGSSSAFVEGGARH